MAAMALGAISMTPVPYLFFRIIWTAHRIQFPLLMPVFNIKEVRVSPEPAAPFGRKGLALASAWKQLAKPDTAGMLLLDGDVMVDPHDVMMMLVAINKEPGAVHIGPAKLWPVTMGDAPGWVWGHCRNAEWSQVMTENPDFFAFNFTYVPRAVIEMAIRKELSKKQFPEVDRFVSRMAREMGVPMRVVADCHPKHMHFLCAVKFSGTEQKTARDRSAGDGRRQAGPAVECPGRAAARLRHPARYHIPGYHRHQSNHHRGKRRTPRL